MLASGLSGGGFEAVTDDAQRRVYLWRDRTLYATTHNHTGWHRHFGASIAVSVAEPFLLETRRSRAEYRAALVPPNLEHRTLAPSTRMAVLIVDPDCAAFRPWLGGLSLTRVQELAASEFATLHLDMQAILEGRADRATVQRCAAGMLASQAQQAPALDLRIQTVLQRIRSSFPDCPSLAALAGEQGLSPNRLMTLFKRNLGLPMRRYFLWLRLRAAARYLDGSGTLTEAAHAAGFADSAHFSRVFQQNFGMRPSDIFRAREAGMLQIMERLEAD
ncbi:MAG: AraC family transcriptional regulator [Leptospirales bacterium]|nr:AraC family transcriptional regulator [Leptospirales bacterium]